MIKEEEIEVKFRSYAGVITLDIFIKGIQYKMDLGDLEAYLIGKVWNGEIAIVPGKGNLKPRIKLTSLCTK